MGARRAVQGRSHRDRGRLNQGPGDPFWLEWVELDPVAYGGLSHWAIVPSSPESPWSPCEMEDV